MKKILFSLMTMVLVIGLVGAGAFAYFSDVEESTGNTFTAGTIDIDVSDDEGANFQNPWERINKVIGAEMKPCEKVWDIIVVRNCGNNDLNLWKHLAFEDWLEKGNVYHDFASSEPEYVAEEGTFTDDGIPVGDNEPVFNIDTKIDYSLIIARKADLSWGDSIADFDTATGIPGAEDTGTNDLVVVAQGSIKLSEVWCHWYGPWLLASGKVLVIAQDYHILADTGNEYQGDGVKFTVDFYAEQLGGPESKP